ncbi:hypothetical protein D1159_00265 [Pseudoflavonifractor sp. 524-17]|uniref:hypothetical protein n=1 Tax=Pseudoflavonifractor sp. 524-17 TaxID=2304577 RepID=UPI001379F398|nr:hypothetical protein [Pseudoflavonifractor sp. 524-17]NCE63045.1 hypothetical protein [Pseudoflavonifractor sp. 524-17]
MYLEKGVEEFGENHKPSPFTIACPYCGGWAMDVSGIQKVPGGRYVPLPDGYSYFANVGNRDCGVPTFPAGEAKKEPKKQTKVLIADELDGNGVGAPARAIKYLADCMERETQEIEEVACMIAERTGVSMEAAEGMILNVLQRDAGGLRECLEELNSLLDADSRQMAKNREFLDPTTAWDQKEAREKLRAVERETASRFRQRKARESAWAARKRIGQRKREWRGSWREAKRTN